MADSVGEVAHGLCHYELRYASYINVPGWAAQLPAQVHAYCEQPEDEWMTSAIITNAWLQATERWRTNSTVWPKWGPEPEFSHAADWQRRTGVLAAQPTWHVCCRAELHAALGAIGREFAQIILDNPLWDTKGCEGGRILFLPGSWAIQFQASVIEIENVPYAPDPYWGTHAPDYHWWIP